MYVFAGCQIKNYRRVLFNDLHFIDLANENYEWVKISVEGKTPEPRFGHVAVKYHDQMIIHGGKGNIDDLRSVYLSDMWTYNISKKYWM